MNNQNNKSVKNTVIITLAKLSVFGLTYSVFSAVETAGMSSVESLLASTALISVTASLFFTKPWQYLIDGTVKGFKLNGALKSSN